MRADSAPRGRAPATGTGRWYRQLQVGLRPLRNRRSRRALRITALTAICLAVAVAAGLAGLRWADSGRADPVAMPQLSSAPASSGGLSARPDQAASGRTRPTVGTSAVQRPTTTGAPAAGTSRPPVASGTDPAARTDPARTDRAGRTDWTATVQALDQARSRALARRDPALLDAVYTRDSAARSADALTIRTLVAQGLRVSGAQHRVQSVEPVAGAAATVLVRDSMPSYDVLGATGSVIGRTPQRAASPRLMVLVSTTAGYRISDVRAAGSTAPSG